MPPGVRHVRMYNCGPTVYGRQHIGNLSMFVFTDVLRRVLEYNDFSVKQVINITDVGHLSSDADSGEDKMTLGLRREGMTLTLENMRLLADKYATLFTEDLQRLAINISAIQFPRASDYITAQIAMVKTLQEKGYAYSAKDGVYFDTSKFRSYAALGGTDQADRKEGARVKAVPDKRHAADFVLWKLDKKIGWDSPWGKGFPGWHVECSAMIRATLGQQIDIHTGGIEHIPIHHNNEIAQSEVATGRSPLSRFWLHRAHIQIEGGKIAKSGGNVIYLSDLIDKGFHPLALRYLFLQAHYRTPSNFSLEALGSAEQAYLHVSYLLKKSETDRGGRIVSKYQKRFHERINDDLDTPGALAVLWETLKDSSVPEGDRRTTAIDMDRVLGLNLANPSKEVLRDAYVEYGAKEVVKDAPPDVQKLLGEREQAREGKDFARADEIRGRIRAAGFDIMDMADGPRLIRAEEQS